MYANEGFALGLKNFSNVVVSSVNQMGSSAIMSLKDSISKMSELINSDLDSSPVIRPVLDMSDITSGANKINSLLSDRKGINVSSVNKMIPQIQNGSKSSSNNESQTESSPVSFVQNNYSPTPLSRIDIYRQTKNQLSAMKGLVRTV
jgi:hypothetical protein